MANRASELFDHFFARGETLIDEYIQQGWSEDLFLDFKRAEKDGAAQRPGQSDIKNLAKAISGFANSEGGVIVWGVDCRKNPDGADIPGAKFPIVNAARFKSWLEEYSSGLVVPTCPGVRHCTLVAPGLNNGYVATLIPRSDQAPHQMIADSRYYMRAGSSFVPVPHAILSGLFGRRPAPRIVHKFLITPPEQRGNSEIVLDLGFSLQNVGRVLASTPYASIRSLSGQWLAIAAPSSDTWQVNTQFHNAVSVVAKEGMRIAPEGIVHLCQIQLKLALPVVEPLSIEGVYGAEGSIPSEFKFEISVILLRNLFTELDRAFKAGTDRNAQVDIIHRLLDANLRG